MKGKITLEFDGPQTKMVVRVSNVGIADKCQAVDNLLSALEATGLERLMILASVAKRASEEVDKKDIRAFKSCERQEENKDESRRFRD